MLQAEPNALAYAALLVWPLVSLILFIKRPAGQALIWTILGGYLLLPVGTSIKFAGIPAFDKNSIPSLSALVGCLLIARKPPAAGASLAAIILVAMLLVGPFITSEFNGDPLVVGGVYGSWVIPGVGNYDALSATVSQLIVLLPFLLGHWFLRHSRDSTDVLRSLTIAGLIYSIPMLLEIRLSPQLHSWIYGYFPHQFIQQMREGGFRPVVFLGHGLLVAFFTATTVLAAAALYKTQTRTMRLPPAGVAVWLSGGLLFCKSLGSLVYAAVLVPVITFAKPHVQMWVAAALVSVALAYPILRTSDLFPTDAILDLAAEISTDRQASMKVRFDQEAMLLEHTASRIWFGWGRFGRGRVYDEWGKDITITDGYWIILISSFGLFGFFAEFGLLALAVYRAARALRYTKSLGGRIHLAALALIVAVSVVDLLPNASISPWTWLLVGALLGRADLVLSPARQRQRKSVSDRSLSSKPDAIPQ